MQKQTGFTLIEIMIAGLIGAFVITGLINLFITVNRTIILSDAMGRNQDSGRFAIEYMTEYVRQAGYSEDETQNLASVFITSGNGASAINCAAGSTTQQNGACAENNPDDPDILGDVLSIPFSVGGDAEDETRACTGTVVGGTTNGPQNLASVFWVSGEESTIRELRCRIYNRDTDDWLDNPVSIINNVEKFEFQIGVAMETDDRNTAKYVSVDTLINDATLTVENIRSIRIALLTTSQDTLDDNLVNTTVRERQYNLLDSPTYSRTDGNLRNIFANTVELPKMIGQAGVE